MATNAKNLAELLNTDTTVKVGDIEDGSVTTAKLAADAVTAAKLADDSVVTANVVDGAITAVKTTSVGKGKNLVINGAMQIAQRATSSTGFVATANYLTVDRFKLENGSSGTFTVSQSTDSPTEFANSLKFDCTTADASPDYFLIVHRFEGQNLQHLQKGTSSSKQTTLSFHVKSNKTGTYQVNLRDVDNSRIIGKTYTISAANTWEKKTVTFAGDTSGVLDNDNGNSMQLEWWLASGSTYNSGSTPTAWEAISNGDRAAGLNVAIGASTSDEFYITGVQFEVGSAATDFEHRSVGEELFLCQRYYYKSDTIDSGQNGSSVGGGYSTYFSASWALPTTMRATPTIIQNISVTTDSTGVQAGFATPTTYNYNHGNMTGLYSYWGGSFILEAEL